MQTLRDVLVEELKDLYDAEKQLVKALPKMAKAASSEELKEAFEGHLEETKGHVGRLEQAFELLEEKAKSKPCAAMKGLITEGQETTQEDFSDPLLDSAIICAAQKVEHYEIAGYGTVAAWARTLGLDEVADLLDQTLAEEKAADKKLSDVADDIIAEAGAEGSSEEEEETVSAGSPLKKGASNKGGSDKAKRRAV